MWFLEQTQVVRCRDAGTSVGLGGSTKVEGNGIL